MHGPTAVFELQQVARLPMPGDNVAIATRRLEAGTVIELDDTRLTLPHTVLEGHRFVVRPITAGGDLLSWGLPFGTARRAIEPGEYACNERILAALPGRGIDFELPAQANFDDRLERFAFDPDAFRPGRQVAPIDAPGTFLGYRRAGSRGVGTRNHIVVLAVTSRANGFASAVARRFERAADEHPGLDGVVAVTHTEGAAGATPHNLEYVLRSLSGFLVHPNVGAVLVVDYPGDGFGIDELRAYALEHGYPLEHVPHRFHVVERAFGTELEAAERTVREWVPTVAAAERTTEPLSGLKVALQCGGSDAFSGVSGNALAGWVAKLLIRHGGSAVIAETDELMGAEAYVLQNVRDLATAQQLLERIEAFKELVAFHGATAEGNPTGGNNYRGLYNIALKSLGAARKFDPEVCLDHVLRYAEPMTEPGCYFMDTPGNDLESIAGEVAGGANLIFFTTGNGSITNFPFVPTLKFVTTSGRFRMLANEMDVNAGRYNDGESMADLGDEVFELARSIASGERSKGEHAGHSQVQLWRDWAQADGARLASVRSAREPDGVPLRVRLAEPSGLRFRAFPTDRGPAVDQVALVMPTSLCSGQVARLIVDGLNERLGSEGAVTRYVALAHTEGCGSANTEELFMRTVLGHLRHRSVRWALLLEHGCEKTHNDAIRDYLVEHGTDPAELGWASIQLDGGIVSVGTRVAAWFEEHAREETLPSRVEAGPDVMSLALLASPGLPPHAALALADLARGIVGGGGTVVLPSSGTLAESAEFRERLLEPGQGWAPSLAYGQPAERAGLHVMDAPTAHPTEAITGLGGTGVQVMVGHVGTFPIHAHPMIPLLEVSGDAVARRRFADDLDLELDPERSTPALVAALEGQLAQVASGTYRPRLADAGLIDFQLTRGLLGIST